MNYKPVKQIHSEKTWCIAKATLMDSLISERRSEWDPFNECMLAADLYRCKAANCGRHPEARLNDDSYCLENGYLLSARGLTKVTLGALLMQESLQKVVPDSEDR